MNGPTLQVQMLGQFTLRYGDRTISDSDDRSRRVWSLLAYMLYNHGRSFAQEELIHLYWSNGEKSADPGNALKSIFHRIRTALDKLQPGLGRLLIRRKAGRYFWNNVIPLSLDVEDFEAHFHAAEAAGDDDVRLAEYQAALALYAGDPLPRMTDEIWTIPIVAYYHSLYTRAAASAIELLEKQERTAEAVALCRQAIHIEPYQEDLYEHLMRGLLRTGDMKGAMSVYEEMSELLFAHFGVMPSETLRTLYRQATRTVNDRTLTMRSPRRTAAPWYANTTFSRSCTVPKPVRLRETAIQRISACCRSPARTAKCLHAAVWTPQRTICKCLSRTICAAAM